MLKDLSLPKRFETLEERFLKQPFRPKGPGPAAEGWMKDLLSSPLKASKGRYRTSVPSVGLPVKGPASQMMSELRAFGRLARLLRRASPYLSAADLALGIYSSWGKYGTPHAVGNAWPIHHRVARCTRPEHETVGPIVEDVRYLQGWDLNPDSDTMHMLYNPAGVTAPTVERYALELVQSFPASSPVNFDWRTVFANPFPGLATSPAPSFEPAYVLPLSVVAPPLPEGNPETVSAYEPWKAVSRAIEAVTGVSVDPDGKVHRHPSARVAVDLGPITFVPDWASGTVVIASPAARTAGNGSRTPVPPVISIHRKKYDGKKKTGPMSKSTALKIYHALTEVSDATDVLADAIPGKPCKKLPGLRKAACVANHFSEIDWGEALPGLIYDQLEDRAVAYVHQFAAQQGFGPNVVQMTQWQRQLKMLHADPLSVMKPGAAEKAIKAFLKADLRREGGIYEFGGKAKSTEFMRSY